jgi:hypothetical protein
MTPLFDNWSPDQVKAPISSPITQKPKPSVSTPAEPILLDGVEAPRVQTTPSAPHRPETPPVSKTRLKRIAKDGTDEITTRIPARLGAYTKALAALHFGTLRRMHVSMMDQFLEEKPWTKGLHWRRTKALVERKGIGAMATGWVQVNLRLPTPTIDQIRDEAAYNQVSPSTFLYTAFYWWTWYKYPPRDEVERRRRKAIEQGRAARGE